MKAALLGRKRGMTQVFDDQAQVVPVTIIEAGPCWITQRKTPERDGYAGYQVGFEQTKAHRLTKAQRVRLEKSNLPLLRRFREVQLEGDYKVGDKIGPGIFSPGERVDVIGVSKGRGFAGVMKRHGFSGGPKTHGSMVHRKPMSSGDTNANKTYKGRKKPGRHGGKKVTALNLSVVGVDEERNLLLVRGSVPGPIGGLVTVRKRA